MNLKGISPDFDRYIPKSVPQWLSKTIRQMMTVNPDERPQNGQVLLDLLQENKLENKKSADSRETPRNIQTKTKHAGNIQYTDYSGFNGLVSLYKSYETITTDDNSHPLMYQDGQMSSGLTQENKSKSQANAQSSQTPQNTQSTEKTSGNIKKYTDYLDLKKSKALLKLSQTIRNDKKLHPLKYRDDKIYPKQLVDSYNPAGMVMAILVSCVGTALLSVSIPAFSDGNVLLGFFMIVVSFFCFVPLFCFLSKRKRYCEMIGFDNSDINTEIQILVQNALTGKAEAQYNLARRYDSGFELQQDKYLALEWYKLAAAKGHISSRKRIVELYNELADHIS
jgi:TPR repeat protein